MLLRALDPLQRRHLSNHSDADRSRYSSVAFFHTRLHRSAEAGCPGLVSAITDFGSYLVSFAQSNAFVRGRTLSEGRSVSVSAHSCLTLHRVAQ